MDIEKYIDEDLLNRYEFYNYGHALEILHDAFISIWLEGNKDKWRSDC